MHVEYSSAARVIYTEPTAGAAPPPLADHGRVLIVDDSEINRRILAGILRRERYTLLSATDGEQAVAMATAEPPDLILLDIMMPGKDGYRVCAELKANPRTERVPVVFLSALSEVADKIKGLELGAVDYITKPFDPGEVLARVRSQLKIQRLATELLRANLELNDKQERLEEDLKAAGAIQRSLLPSAAPPIDNLRLAWRFMPCGRVGGDVLNFCPLGDDTLGVFVIDVSGHGVPAAMVTVSLSQFLSPHAGHLMAAGAHPGEEPTPAPPSHVLRLLDDEYPMERFDKFFTIAYALIDHRSGRLRYSLGGHPQPLLQRAGGGIETLDAGGPLIGFGLGSLFAEAEVMLAPGDRLFLYTDGLVEMADSADAQFGDERLYEAVQGTRGLPLEAACDRLLGAALAFGGGVEPQDDVTLLAIEFTGAGEGVKC